MSMVNVIVTILVVITPWASAATTAEAQWGNTIKSGRQRKTTLQFYFHDTLSGKSPSAIRVAQPITPNPTQTEFGVLNMADDPLTIGPDRDSKIVGRAQGLYGSACQEEVGLIMALSYTFSDGPYNGSSISLMGRNSIMQTVREMPIVGGTGLFRMGRGYALAQTYWFDRKSGDAIVGYNVTIVH
ncbi:hypothetical protein vseg_007004 [Gypsophila vaccaria]